LKAKLRSERSEPVTTIMQYFVPFGLGLNFVGTVLVALSIGKNPEAMNPTKRGPVYFASFRHPAWFRWGLGLIAVGFLLQLLPEAMKLMG
jgi:hypothetical protein